MLSRFWAGRYVSVTADKNPWAKFRASGASVPGGTFLCCGDDLMDDRALFATYFDRTRDSSKSVVWECVSSADVGMVEER